MISDLSKNFMNCPFWISETIGSVITVQGKNSGVCMPGKRWRKTHQHYHPPRPIKSSSSKWRYFYWISFYLYWTLALTNWFWLQKQQQEVVYMAKKFFFIKLRSVFSIFMFIKNVQSRQVGSLELIHSIGINGGKHH